MIGAAGRSQKFSTLRRFLHGNFTQDMVIYNVTRPKGGMALDLNKKNIKRIMLLIAFAALLYWGLNNLKWISGVLGSLLDLLSPLLIGICIAFVLNLMMVALERLWDRGLIKWNSPWNAKLKRPVCLTLTLLLFLGIIFAIFFILIPRLEEAGTTMVANIPTYVNQIQVWWTNLSDFAAEHGVTLPELSLSADQVKDTITGFLQEKGDSVVNTTLNITTSILSALVNFLLALVFSPVSAGPEGDVDRPGQAAAAAYPAPEGRRPSYAPAEPDQQRLFQLRHRTGDRGVYPGHPVLHRYADPAPALRAAGIGHHRVPVADPHFRRVDRRGHRRVPHRVPKSHQGADLLIFLLILQQVEGNLIYPKVVGKSVGLPGLWVLAAVTIGGGAFWRAGYAAGRTGVLGGLCAGAGLHPFRQACQDRWRTSDAVITHYI